ncbi:UNVERIFIED_CONTAM: hypothetical protein FKN15_024458 [Acipenser sinensis]
MNITQGCLKIKQNLTSLPKYLCCLHHDFVKRHDYLVKNIEAPERGKTQAVCRLLKELLTSVSVQPSRTSGSDIVSGFEASFCIAVGFYMQYVMSAKSSYSVAAHWPHTAASSSLHPALRQSPHTVSSHISQLLER